MIYCRALLFAHLKVQPWLLVSIEVTLPVLLGQQRLELRQGEALAPSASARPGFLPGVQFNTLIL